MWPRDRAGQLLGIRIPICPARLCPARDDGPPRHAQRPPHLPRRPDLHPGRHRLRLRLQQLQQEHRRFGLPYRFSGAGQEGDILEAEASMEQSLSGRTGVYDITVRTRTGKTVALFAASPTASTAR